MFLKISSLVHSLVAQRHCKTGGNPFLLPSFLTLRSPINHVVGVQLWQDTDGMWISLVLLDILRKLLKV